MSESDQDDIFDPAPINLDNVDESDDAPAEGDAGLADSSVGQGEELSSPESGGHAPPDEGDEDLSSTDESDEPFEPVEISIDEVPEIGNVSGNLLESFQQTLNENRTGSEGAESANRSKLVRIVTFDIKPPLSRPVTLTLADDDRLYVLDRPQSDALRIVSIPASGGPAEVHVTLARGNADHELLDPVGLAVTQNGEFIIPDAEAGMIKRFSGDGRWLDTIDVAGDPGLPLDNPSDVDLDGDGNLFIRRCV